ncbi:MAG: hypothetical protein J4G15_07695 [Alphaproteobacteria bacterium]|nr:hypothetical protein [Alphaproteobacteria bacterium]
MAEGESERAFSLWLSGLCDNEGLHVHFDIAVAGGGGTRWIVDYAVEQRRRRNAERTRDSGAFVLLDADRVPADQEAGRDPEEVKGRGDLQLVYLRPNIEGLLVRLHPGHERRVLAPSDARRRLQQLWREYDKPASAAQLHRRFVLEDLRRAARYDADLKNPLVLLGLN